MPGMSSSGRTHESLCECGEHACKRVVLCSGQYASWLRAVDNSNFKLNSKVKAKVKVKVEVGVRGEGEGREDPERHYCVTGTRIICKSARHGPVSKHLPLPKPPCTVALRTVWRVLTHRFCLARTIYAPVHHTFDMVMYKPIPPRGSYSIRTRPSPWRVIASRLSTPDIG